MPSNTGTKAGVKPDWRSDLAIHCRRPGLVELTGDDRAALYGAFLTLAMMLRGKDREHTLALWRRGGRRAFENDNTPD